MLTCVGFWLRAPCCSARATSEAHSRSQRGPCLLTAGPAFLPAADSSRRSSNQRRRRKGLGECDVMAPTGCAQPTRTVLRSASPAPRHYAAPSNRYTRRLETRLSNRKQKVATSSNRYSSHPAFRCGSGCFFRCQRTRPEHCSSSLQPQAARFLEAPNAVFGAAVENLPGTANRVETQASRRKQTIGNLSTRHSSHPLWLHHPFAFRLDRALAERTLLVVFLSAGVGGDKIPVKRLGLSSSFPPQLRRSFSPLTSGILRTASSCHQRLSGFRWGRRDLKSGALRQLQFVREV
jgi:hypothetical protein